MDTEGMDTEGPLLPGAETRGPTEGFLRWMGLWLLRAPRVLAWGLVLAHVASIWALSSVSNVGPANDSILWAILGNAAHAPLFGFLGLFLAGALLREGPHGWARITKGAVVGVLSLVAAYGAIDEWHQSLVPGRNPSLLDLVTDLVGGTCVLWIVGYLGQSGRTERGLWMRLAGGVALCFASAIVASVF